MPQNDFHLREDSKIQSSNTNYSQIQIKWRETYLNAKLVRIKVSFFFFCFFFIFTDSDSKSHLQITKLYRQIDQK